MAVYFSAQATETEHLDFEILPAPGKVAIDGRHDDWDLSAGIFACGNVENAASQFAVWFHAMYDRDNLYMLARWVDPTPMNNPGTVKGDYGFNGDCLQVRIITAPDITAREVVSPERNAKDAALVRASHLTCWRDRDGLDVIDVAWGRNFNEGGLKNAKTEGALQAFAAWPDGKGYTQEIAIPWKLLCKPGVEMKAGMRIVLTIEPNFTIGTGGRLSIKDIFKPGVPIDRVFTFTASRCWGHATLAEKGNVQPRPVRLSDGREFAVRLEGGLPVVDWTGLIRSRMPEGFKEIAITLPEDGYVSLNIWGPGGMVVRQLLTCHFLTKGTHRIMWDGLTTMSVRRPGMPVAAGQYTWEAIYHTGIGLRLRGWAGNSGPAPWRGWGADHGNPQGVAAAADRVYVGWTGGEGDKPLLAADLKGNIIWKNIRGGIASAAPLATDGTTVYAFNNVGQYVAKGIYRLDAKTGRYTEWTALNGTDLLMKHIWGDAADAPGAPSALAAAGGKVFIGFQKPGTIVIVDAVTGLVDRKLAVPSVGAIAAASAQRVLAVSGTQILEVDAASGQTRPFVKPALGEKDWISALALDKAGNLYAGIRGENHQVLVYAPDGSPVRAIGRKGGRALLGPWTPDGMYNIGGMAVDGEDKLWVAEDDGAPRRVSVWDTRSGAFVMEFFGAASYGATGAAINPLDPYLMVGQGCEWRIDPATGRSVCLGTITRHGMGISRFGTGPNNRLYLAVTPHFLHGDFPIRIYERLGDANYKLRAMLRQITKDSPEKGRKLRQVEVWSDANDDAEEQADEVKRYDIDLGGWPAGWYMAMTQDLTFYGSLYQVKVTGWTPCGAPLYDLSQAKRLPAAADVGHRGGMGAHRGHGSADGRFMLYNGAYGEDHSTVDCWEIDSGRLVWTYPSNFTGVHGSHRACGPETGMIRGAYDIVGAARLPAPVGNIWVIPTNKGEWHILTEKGFYLTRLFEGDPMKNVWPEQAVPGASLDTCPPGAGEEAFGGSISQHPDGRLSVQAGHISYWNCEVVGLDRVRALPGGSITITEQDVAQAAAYREKYLQQSVAAKRLVAARATPVFTGDLDKDFASSAIVSYQKQPASAVRTALAWDDNNLYAGWEVKDSTPWINGADAPEFMYARGDTVDLQLGTDPSAPPGRREAVMGDLRLSIGPYEGKPTAVIYRKAAAEKHPKAFRSGVVAEYVMESVLVVKQARIEVKVDAAGKRYVVEAAIPLKELGFRPAPGQVLRGDVGATHGDRAGKDTVLRTYWSNQNTGLVSDEVFELQMNPSAWGEIVFK